jgi:hypothetical protein
MKKTIFYLAALTLVTVSCSEDFLVEEPKLSQSNELTLSKFEGLDNSTAGAYLYLQSNAWFGCQYILNGELMAGNATNPKSMPGSGRYRTQEPWSFTESSTWSTWAYAYYTINAVNNVLANLDGKTSLEVKQADIDNLEAECLFLRAFCHFQLVNIYAQPYLKGANRSELGVPVMLKSTISSPARNTVGQVYDQVVADLLRAESLMSDKYQRKDVTDPKASVTKPAIQALLSRVYLYMGEWQKSADYATLVINNSNFNLADTSQYVDMWSKSIADKDGGEVIFEVYSSKKNDSWDDSGWTMLPYITSVDGSADVCATNDLYDLFEDGDIRKTLFKDNESDHFFYKYPGKPGSVDPKENNIPVLRLAEMYLNRAEAIWNGAAIANVSAQTDLDAITNARGASQVSPGVETIFNERRRELAFEGHIFFDYKRLGKSITRTDFRATQNKDVAFPGKIWAMPIPKAECDANPNMVQNPY